MAIFSEELIKKGDGVDSKALRSDVNDTYKPKTNVLKNDLKAELFARTYIQNGLNGKEAARVINPNTNEKNLVNVSRQMLSKKKVQELLYGLLPKIEEDVDVINKAYAAQLPSNIAFKDAIKYVELSMKLKGLLDDKQKDNNVNIGLVIEN